MSDDREALEKLALDKVDAEHFYELNDAMETVSCHELKQVAGIYEASGEGDASAEPTELDEVTAAMHTLEKMISTYNKKYDFDLEGATDDDRRQWQAALDAWDKLKQFRDTLKPTSGLSMG